MAQATLYHGDPLMVDYTPGSAVSAGDVVVIGSKPYVAHTDIAANALGAVAAQGGVYLMTVSGDYDPGEAVYWNDTTNELVDAATTGAHKHFGYIVPNSNPAADGDTVYAEHAPNGGVSAT